MGLMPHPERAGEAILGGTDGLVTIKDIFEELVGPVAERWDVHRPIIKRIAPEATTYPLGNPQDFAALE